MYTEGSCDPGIHYPDLEGNMLKGEAKSHNKNYLLKNKNTYKIGPHSNISSLV